MNLDQTETPAPKRQPTAVITPSTVPTGEETPPRTREAIAEISSFQFNQIDLDSDDDGEGIIAMMMFNNRQSMGGGEPPPLRTGKWAHHGAKACKMLAAAYAAVPCETEGTGIHGYAWLVETKLEWGRREGVAAHVDIPTQPPRELDYEYKKQLEYAAKMEEYKTYNQLVQQGNDKLVEWFDASMFGDLHVGGVLPATTTPRELLDHLTKTYGQGRNHR